jgi:hypothetical protein
MKYTIPANELHRSCQHNNLPAALQRGHNNMGSGCVWYLVFPDGYRFNTIHTAAGRDMFHKNTMERIVRGLSYPGPWPIAEKEGKQ